MTRPGDWRERASPLLSCRPYLILARYFWLRFVEEWFGQKKNAEIADLKDKIQALEESLKMAQEEITVLKMPPEAAAEDEEQE